MRLLVRVAVVTAAVAAPMVLGLGTSTARDQRRASARAGLMSVRGFSHDPAGFGRWLDGLATHVLLDPSDAAWSDEVSAMGATVLLAPVIGVDEADRQTLVQQLGEIARIGSLPAPARSA